MEKYISKNKSSWTKTIEPQTNLFNFQLKEVWNYRDLLILFVRRDFVAFYKQTILGPVWFFIQPIFTMLVYIFLFGNVASLSTDGLPQPLFYLIGIICWSYYSEALTKTANVFKDNANIFGKVYFPRLIMPLSIVISCLIKLTVQSILLIILFLYFKVSIPNLISFIFLTPLFIGLMALQALGIGMLISAMTTKYRDLAILLSFAIQILMYTTTVVYPLSSLKGKIYTLVRLNPLTSVIEGFRLIILGKGSLEIFDLVYSVLSTILILAIGIFVFNKVEKKFIDTI
jgi:lipopolysaccharide transport system permease protein